MSRRLSFNWVFGTRVFGLTFAAILSAGLLAGCAAGWSTGESTGEADTAKLPPPSGVGALVATLFAPARDDEFAVDAREVTPRKSPAKPGVQNAAIFGPNGLGPNGLPKAGSGASAPPKLNVLYVANGRIRATGPQIWIRGTVEDDTDGVEVTVNGQRAAVKDKSFQRRIAVPPGESDVVVRAEDADGNAVTSRFVLVRMTPGQSLPAARPPLDVAGSEYKLIEQAQSDRIPRIDDLAEPGVYMVLMAGTPSAHFVKMPNLAQCREAVEYTENAACMFHRGRD